MAVFPKWKVRLPVDCNTCRASIEGLCRDCAPRVQSIIASYKSGDRTVRAGQTLFHPTEPCDAVLHLVEGWVLLYDLVDDGGRQMLNFMLPGALLGLSPGRTAAYGAEALTDVTVCLVPYERLGQLFEHHPGMALRVLQTVWRERNLAYDHLSNIGRRPARQRIARSLLELFVRRRMQWPAHRSEEMYLPLTQEHIGDMTGLTGVHVNRILHGLRAEGILEFHYRRLRMLNPDKLVDVAQVDAQSRRMDRRQRTALGTARGHQRGIRICTSRGSRPPGRQQSSGS